MKAIIIILSVLFQSLVYAGFGAHTPVMLPTGEYSAIQDIRIGDRILCYDKHGGYIAQEVVDIKSRQAHDCVCVVFDNTHIITAHNQKIYLADRNKWQMAGYLLPGDRLLGKSGETTVVKCVLKISRPVQLYDLTIKEYHNFLVSQYGIVAHNFVPAVALGVSIAFGSGAIELAGITLGVGACTLGLGSLVSWFKNKREEQEFLKVDPVPMPTVQAPQNCVPAQNMYSRDTVISPSNEYAQKPALILPMPRSSLTVCPPINTENSLAGAVKTTIVDSVAQTAVQYIESNSRNKSKDRTHGKEYVESFVHTADDDDDNCPHHIGCKREHPYGLYENAGYHHKYSVGNASKGKSPAPIDGQRALDVSYVKDLESKSCQRVGISHGQFVVLKNTQQNQVRNGRLVDIWHGYAVSWKDLDEKVQRALIKRGICSSKGKIGNGNW